MREPIVMTAKHLKTYDADLSVDEGKREVLAVISTNSIDRDSEVVSPKGMRKKNFAGNPVVLFNHDLQSLPIGKALWVKSDGDKILAKYRISDKTQMARDVFALMQDGVLNSHSIQFVSNYSSKPTTKEINERPDLSDAKLIHRDWELIEFSVVTVPCNPDAQALAVSKAMSKGVSAELLSFLKGNTVEKALEEKEGTAEAEVEKNTQDARTLYTSAVVNAAKSFRQRFNAEQAVAAALNRLGR